MFFSAIKAAFVSGGTWMWLILGLQIFSIAIIIERVIALYVRRKIGQRKYVNQFETLIKSGDIGSVIEKVTSDTKAPTSQVILSGARAAQSYGGKDEIRGKMDEVLMDLNSSLDKRTGFLAMLGNVGTLTGLLGTIVGMIKAFTAVSTASPMEKAVMLSSGISEAMNTTAYGLVMAIPALIMYAVLSNRANELAEDLNQAALKAFNWLSFNYEPVNRSTKDRA